MKFSFPSFLFPPKEDQRGDALGAIILFPVVLILVLLILQMWFWASARTRTRIAADAAVRTAQQSVVDVEDSASTETGLDEAVSSGLNWVVGRRTYLASPSGGYKLCGDDPSDPEVISRSVVPRNEDCQDAESKALVDVRINTDRRLVTANVNGNVSSLLGRVEIPQSEIASRACGLANPQIWAPNRATLNLEDETDPNRWSDTELLC